MIITPAIKYLNIVIPAKAGIQVGTGCRIKSGMTELDYLIARLICYQTVLKPMPRFTLNFILPFFYYKIVILAYLDKI